jgi:hypothetical protein
MAATIPGLSGALDEQDGGFFVHAPEVTRSVGSIGLRPLRISGRGLGEPNCVSVLSTLRTRPRARGGRDPRRSAACGGVSQPRGDDGGPPRADGATPCAVRASEARRAASRIASACRSTCCGNGRTPPARWGWASARLSAMSMADRSDFVSGRTVRSHLGPDVSGEHTRFMNVTALTVPRRRPACRLNGAGGVGELTDPPRRRATLTCRGVSRRAASRRRAVVDLDRRAVRRPSISCASARSSCFSFSLADLELARARG